MECFTPMKRKNDASGNSSKKFNGDAVEVDKFDPEWEDYKFSEDFLTSLETSNLDDDALNKFLDSFPSQLTIEKGTFYGLPMKVKELLKKYRNIDVLYDWQDKLMKKLLQNTNNVIYCVPTSGGKTLVAELLIIKELLVAKRDVLMVLPFVSIVREKVRDLHEFAEELKFVIEEYAGPKGRIPLPVHKDYRTLYIASIEKAHVVVNSLLETGNFSNLGLIVIDELHMIGEGSSRSATLETLIVKCKLASDRESTPLRLLAMSATLNNFCDLSRFLGADFVQNEFRPIELKEYLKVDTNLYKVTKSGHVDNAIAKALGGKKSVEDVDGLKTLVGEVIANNKSCLLFCPTKTRCEDIVNVLVKLLPQKLLSVNIKEKRELIIQIKESNDGEICSVLKRGISKGIAYHNAGLATDERELIERAFLDGVLSCIVCTSTLAAGVNLPAQRVIIRAPYVGKQFMTKATYKQMCGRAGRAGFNEQGESILICSSSELQRVKEVLAAPVADCTSSLGATTSDLANFLLNLIYLQLASRSDDLEDIVLKETLYGILLKDDVAKIKVTINDAVDMLLKEKLIFKRGYDYEVTALGRGVVTSMVPIDKCAALYQHLLDCSMGLAVRNHLHLIFVCTFLFGDEFPMNADGQSIFHNYVNFNDFEKKCVESCGMKPEELLKLRNGGKEIPLLAKRVYAAMIVYEIYDKQLSINGAISRFGIPRGTLQNLLSQIATHANSLFRFVEPISETFFAFAQMLPELCRGLTYCCSPELIPLMRLPAVKMARAKMLHNAGFTDLKKLANISAEKLVMKIQLLSLSHAEAITRAARHIQRTEKDELEAQAELMNVSTQE